MASASSRSVVARLAIDGVEGVVTGFKRVRQAAKDYESVSMKSGKAAWNYIRRHADELDRIGTKLVGLGAIGVGSMGLLAKAAIDWETAWAGVKKTVDGTPEQLSALEVELRELAKVLPASHEEIAAVAEAAGQLGIGIDDIAQFTRTMIDLGETTNLSADEAATALAQFMNIMGTATTDVDRLGATVVALGNNGASTERDIVTMAQRIAGAGKLVGASEGEVLALASALSSMGVSAELGGGVASRVLQDLYSAVADGGDKLIGFAEVSGITAEQFAKDFGEDPIKALTMFADGLNQVEANGGNVIQTLGDLGIKSSEEQRILLQLKANADLVTDSLDLQNEAWKANVALADEAEQRYATREARIQISLNRIKDEAITLGAELLPVVDQILGFVNDMTQAFGDVPPEIQQWGLAILGIGSMAALGAGGVMKMVTAVANFQVGLSKLGVSMRTATLSMGAFGVAIALAGGLVAHWMTQQAEAKERVDRLTEAIEKQQGLITQATRLEAGRQLIDSGMADEAERYGIAIGDLVDAMLGVSGAQDKVDAAMQGHVQSIRDEIDAREEQGLAIGGYGDALVMAENSVERFNGKMNAHKGEFAEAAEAYRVQQELTEQTADATDKAAAAAERNREAQQKQATAYAEVEQELSDLLDATFAYANALLALSGSEIAVESSIANVQERLAELDKGGKGNARTLDLQTEAGRKNQETLDSLARSSISYAETLAEQGKSSDEIAAATERAREQWIAAAVDMGMPKDEAIELAKAYFAIPEGVNTTTTITGDDKAKAEIQRLKAEIDKLPPDKQTKFNALLDQGKYAIVAAELNALARDRIVTYQVKTLGVDPRRQNLYEAHGGVVDYYAGGGIRERHIAQIAPAGSWRVWAEPETGGEAYIPLSPAKRSRSLEIWRETGRRLGVRGYADGMVVTTRSAPSTPAASYSQTVQVLGPDAHEVAQLVRDDWRHWTESEATVRR